MRGFVTHFLLLRGYIVIKNQCFTEIDQTLALLLLEQSALTQKQLRQALIRLTNGNIAYSDRYIVGTLITLRANKLIEQIQTGKGRYLYSITASGR